MTEPDKMIEAVARAIVRTAQMPINDVHAEELARAAISALDPEIANMREALEEAREAFGELLATLRKEAPGTPLNNHRFDGIGLRANNALTKIDAALGEPK